MVVKTPKEFLQDALTNNSFSIDDTDKALRMTLDHSYSYLYRLQRNMECYEEYFYTTRNEIDERDYGDYFMDYRERVCVNFPVALVPHQFREKFRTSKFCGKIVQYEELTKNRTIFTRLPIVLIDNHVLRTFGMDIRDDSFTCHTGLDRYFLHTKKFDNNRWEYFYVDHTTSLQVVKNAEFYDLETNTGMLKRNSYTGYTFDRVLLSYLNEIGFKSKYGGTYFATVFFGDERLGSQLLETSVDQYGDLVIEYDATTLSRLNDYTGPLTVRFYFYRDLKKYISYKDNGTVKSKVIEARKEDGTVTTDTFIIQKDGDIRYQLPVPIENLLIFKMGEETETGFHEPVHFPYSNVDVTYPNFYHITRNVEDGDKFRIYYFYHYPYDLNYEYMYSFITEYIRYFWDGVPEEAVVNAVLHADFSYFWQDNDYHVPELIIDAARYESLLKLSAAYHALNSVKLKQIDEKNAADMYYDLVNTLGTGKLDDIKQAAIERFDPDAEPTEFPEDSKRFAEVFDFMVNHPIVDYRYDEVDYIREHGTTPPFMYKVEKLKEFIKDDWRALLNYVRGQNKVGFKYEIATKDIDLPGRYRTTYENGTPFKEPMYVFPIQRVSPEIGLSARIFVDGLLCPTFAIERFEFSDYFYIPADYLTEESYVEIEVFHYYLIKHVVKFTEENPSVELHFPDTKSMRPTISDIYFYEGTEACLDRIDKEKFNIELITERYNFYVDPDTPVQIFYRTCTHGDKNYGPYYDVNGNYYTFEGQPDPSKNLPTDQLYAKVSTGELVEDTGYLTDNHLQVVRLEDVVTYDRVAAGETTLQSEDNKGLLFAYLTHVRITPLDEDLYGKIITIEVQKKPMYKGTKLHQTSFPQYCTPIPNSQDVEEYTRAFKNGRLMSKNRYDFTDYFDGILGIQVLEKMVRGDTMAFDITPYRNRLIMYRTTFNPDSIDLRGYINKPFDGKFYEVYVNGRRLNKTNIFPISPWEIKLGGVKSYHHLEIYEKDRDWEYYGINFSNYYTFSDFIREPFIDLDTVKKIIEDMVGKIPDNEDTEEPIHWERQYDLVSVYFAIFYYMKLVPMHFVSGSQIDFNKDEIKKKYPIVYDLYHQTNDLWEDVLLLNPDVVYYPQKADEDELPEDEQRWEVYLLGNTVTEDLDDDEPEPNDYWKGDGQ